MQDSEIIELFWQRSEQAVSELADKYGKLLHKIAIHIVNNEQDAKECVNDTYFGVWNQIPPQSPNPLLAFVCKITRNISLKKYRSNTAQKRNPSMEISLDELGDCIPMPSVEEEWNAKQLGSEINAFLGTLASKQRIIFLRRYWFGDSVKEIAQLFQMSETHVSVTLNRIRKKLKYYLESEKR